MGQWPSNFSCLFSSLSFCLSVRWQQKARASILLKRIGSIKCSMHVTSFHLFNRLLCVVNVASDHDGSPHILLSIMCACVETESQAVVYLVKRFSNKGRALLIFLSSLVGC